MKPKGKLLLIGGGEDRVQNKKPEMNGKLKDAEPMDILGRALLPGSKSTCIEVITTSHRFEKETRKIYRDTFRALGKRNCGYMVITDKEAARNPNYIQRVEQAGAIFFTGGNQFEQSTVLAGTPVSDVVRQRYQQVPDFIAAGASAGAMIMSSVMIREGGVYEGLLKSDLKTCAGLGLIDCCIIDTHFIQRGRFGRLAQAIIMNPELIGIGLGVDTALLIENGNRATCYGSGTVVIIDGNEIGQTNIADADEDEAVFVENLKVHLLTKGCRFDLKLRQLHNPAIHPRKRKATS
jgi:cyanophycinase